jgi:transcriptional regulator with AAA-type ATPase domain
VGGYCFLDEIGDLPPRLSTKVLRFFRSNGFSVWEAEPESDARGIAATNCALKTGIAKGIFRKGFMLGGLNVSPAATRLKEARGNLEREMVQRTLKRHLERSVRSQGTRR